MGEGPHHHGHEHHDHDHTHHERYADRTHPEFVVLEIGGELGALIIYTDADMHGREIEISPGGTPAFSAVFDQIPDGRYTLWVDDVARSRDVRVAGGEVGELDWRGDAALRGTASAHAR